LISVFAGEAAGGSVFLLAKSLLPPTVVADAAAAVVAASLTMAILGSVALLLERGESLSEKQKLRQTFRRLQAKTKAERAEILRGRARWTEREYWVALVRRLVFD